MRSGRDGACHGLDERLIQTLGIDSAQIERVVDAELQELERREAAYRGAREPPDLEGKTVILVDDGLATGSTMRAAALAVRRQNPARIIVAVPVAAAETCDAFRDDVDEIYCGLTPQPFTPSACGTRTSRRRAMTRFESSWRGRRRKPIWRGSTLRRGGASGRRRPPGRRGSSWARG